MKFDEYPIAPVIKKNLGKKGFEKPTDIQFKAIPHILRGEDVLAIAQTGTGKTAAFAIPIIHLLQERKHSRTPDQIRCVVLVPTRELAIQINDVFMSLAQQTGVRSTAIFGGVEQNPQIARLVQGVDIIVTTPGRMFDLRSQGHIVLERVDMLVLDEADHMLKLGFLKDIQDLIKYLPKRRQTLFFSATINEEIKQLAYSLVNKPVRIQISPKDPVSKNVDHFVVMVNMDDKRFFLEYLIKQHPESKILVFVRTKVRAERVVKALERVGILSQAIHGGKEQSERFTVLRDFMKGAFHVMVATDVSARGIDIPHVNYVVNYDLPEQLENYVHRVGRTGRGQNRGTAVAFCDEEEKGLLKEIEDYLGKPVEKMWLEKDQYDQIIESSPEAGHNWKQLLREAEETESKRKKKKK
ncbi:MAG: DEAD/DEAH box helicase [Cytophagales bacterium]|nr:DEAD/DEAH box helicase [Cytophagales bacterium]